MTGVTAKQLKTLTGRSVPTIRTACQRAGVEPRGDLFDRDAALAAIEAEVDPARVTGHGSRGLGEAKETEVGTYASVRARAEAARAAKLELELKERRGELVEREAVISAGRDLVARVRSDLLAVGLRAAPLLVGLTDEAKIAAEIAEQIRIVLGALAESERFTAEVLS